MLSAHGSFSLTYEVLCRGPPIPAGESGTNRTAEAYDVAGETQPPSCILVGTA
jgi:hypothetical protein